MRLLDGQGAQDPSPNLGLKVPGMQAGRAGEKIKRNSVNKKTTNGRRAVTYQERRAAVTSDAEQKAVPAKCLQSSIFTEERVDVRVRNGKHLSTRSYLYICICSFNFTLSAR